MTKNKLKETDSTFSAKKLGREERQNILSNEVFQIKKQSKTVSQ